MNIKFILLLDKFTKTDIKEFKKFLSSPVHSKKRNYFPMLNRLIVLKKKNKKILSDDEIYLKLVNGNKLKNQTYRNRLSELYKLGEDYLIYKSLKENKSYRDILLLNQLQKYNLNDLFEKKLNLADRYINSRLHDDEKFLSKFTLDRLNLNYLRKNKLTEKAYKKYYKHAEYYSGNFLINLFSFAVELIQQKNSNRHYEFNMIFELLGNLDFEKITVNLKIHKPSLYKIILMQYYFYKIFRDPLQEKYYFEGKKIFKEISGQLDKSFISETYKLMAHYCIIRQNQGNSKFQSELFTLYNEKLRKNFYKSDDDNPEFSVTDFRNYVLLGILMKKIAWTENFIKKYSGELPVKNRIEEINLSYSKLFFRNKNYLRSLNYLDGFKGTVFAHYTDSSILKLCNYYELERYDDAYLEIDKLRHYMKSHTKVVKSVRDFILNFLTVYQKLLKIKSGVNKNHSAFLNKKSIDTKYISRKEWLEEKFRELKIFK